MASKILMFSMFFLFVTDASAANIERYRDNKRQEDAKTQSEKKRLKLKIRQIIFEQRSSESPYQHVLYLFTELLKPVCHPKKKMPGGLDEIKKVFLLLNQFIQYNYYYTDLNLADFARRLEEEIALFSDLIPAKKTELLFQEICLDDNFIDSLHEKTRGYFNLILGQYLTLNSNELNLGLAALLGARLGVGFGTRRDLCGNKQRLLTVCAGAGIGFGILASLSDHKNFRYKTCASSHDMFAFFYGQDVPSWEKNREIGAGHLREIGLLNFCTWFNAVIPIKISHMKDLKHLQSMLTPQLPDLPADTEQQIDDFSIPELEDYIIDLKNKHFLNGLPTKNAAKR